MYERFYFAYVLSSSSTKFINIGNLYCFRNLLLPFQPGAFRTSSIESSIMLALLVDALRTECVANIGISIPVIARKSFIYLLWIVN